MDDRARFYEDDVQLEKELRAAMRSDEEIDLFKTVRRALAVRDELANSEVVQLVVGTMWEQVAEFAENLFAADTICNLPPDHELVLAHTRMRANIDAVARINGVITEGKAAEQQLVANDELEREQGEVEP